jgi:type VI secretion system secreted protein VgrG
MEVLNTIAKLQDSIAKIRTNRCETRFSLVQQYKESMGTDFDNMDFLNYETGNLVKGKEIRDAQTGCEIFQKLGWESAAHNHDRSLNCGCKQFDEQLRFISEKGTPLSNIEYRLKLGDGRTLKSKTDNDGKTIRIKSANNPLAIEKAEFFVPDNMPRCLKDGCSSGKTEEAVKQIDIEGIKTTQENIGSSFQTVVVKIKSRPLTAGEIEMAILVFKDSIDYTSVRVHNEEYLPFGFQDDNTAMTPNGEMYFNPEKYKEDYSKEYADWKIWFMHEMVHVWQYQQGYRVKWNSFWVAVSGGYAGQSAYKYDKKDTYKTLPDYNMEQQGDIIAEYYGAKYLNEKQCVAKLPFFERLLKEFLRRPKNAALCPK